MNKLLKKITLAAVGATVRTGRKYCEGTPGIIQERDDSGLAKGGGPRGRKEWTDLGQILKAGLIKFNVCSYYLKLWPNMHNIKW